ncbi:mechanosensitive ion channel family protein [Sulfuriflexus mobilis]|uniref:mechanosensitive ion channel family protein n=1 Tax=Sulfuriflexus mobilis TaxID=1811807 RepID=UPI000F849FAC|nr:mechanosensitive ion channel domain-containing protein [Sulfuriflexus mobilis]
MEVNTLKELIELLSLSSILSAALAILVGWLLLLAIRFSLQHLAEHFPRYRLQIGQTFPVSRIVVWGMVLIYVVFGIIKPPAEIMFAALGAVGLAVGLAAQDGIRNVLAGFMMIYNPPFRVGDMVQLGDHYGEVERIDLSVTWLRSFDDNTIMVPNAELLKQAVVNSNSGELAEMVTVKVDFPDDVAINEIKKIAREVAMCSPYTYLKKPVSVLVEPRYEYRSLLRFTIKAYVLDVRLERRLASDITERLYDAIHERFDLNRDVATSASV